MLRNFRGSSFENVESIIARCNKQLDVAPNDVTALIRRGLAHASMGDHRKAIVDFHLAIKHDPKSVDALHNRGNAWVSLGKLGKGIADLTKAIRLDPNSAVSYTSRGVAWSRKGRYANALADYDLAMAKPSDPSKAPDGFQPEDAFCYYTVDSIKVFLQFRDDKRINFNTDIYQDLLN